MRLPDSRRPGAPTVTAVDGLSDSVIRRRILQAGIDELSTTSVGAFSIDRVAQRAEVDPDTIRGIWPNTPELFTATVAEFSRQYLPVPDTGTLRGDFLDYARSYAKILNTPVGRRMLNALIVKADDWELTGARDAFLQERLGRMDGIVRRAIMRGECPDDTDPALTLDMLGIGLCLPVLWYDRPLSDDHCEYVVDTLLHGILRKR